MLVSEFNVLLNHHKQVLCRRPPFLEPEMGAIFMFVCVCCCNVFYVFVSFWYVFVVFCYAFGSFYYGLLRFCLFLLHFVAFLVFAILQFPDFLGRLQGGFKTTCDLFFRPFSVIFPDEVSRTQVVETRSPKLIDANKRPNKSPSCFCAICCMFRRSRLFLY